MIDHNYIKYYTFKDHDIVLDLGATDGDFAKQNLKEFQQKQIQYIAVEPSLFNISQLSHFLNENLLEQSILISAGTYSSRAIVPMNVADNAQLHALDNTENRFRQSFVWRSNIIVYDLDFIIKLLVHKYKKISFVKCDIEGAELETFMNSKLLHRIDYMAIASYHIVNNEETWIKLQPFIESCGFEVIHEDLNRDAFDDLLYCKKL